MASTRASSQDSTSFDESAENNIGSREHPLITPDALSFPLGSRQRHETMMTETSTLSMNDIQVSIQTCAGEKHVPNVQTAAELWNSIAAVAGLTEIEVTLVGDDVDELSFKSLCAVPKKSVMCCIRRWADVVDRCPREVAVRKTLKRCGGTAETFGSSGCFLSDKMVGGFRYTLKLRLQGGPNDLVDCWILRCIVRDLKEAGIREEGWRLRSMI
jgi:hypothetical protein